MTTLELEVPGSGSRRRWAPPLGALLCCAGVLTIACGGEAATTEMPNVLLITVDTTRADFLGAYGHPEVQTPNINALAAEGALFTRAIAPSQTTNPSHSSILTGLYVARHNVYDNETALAGEALTLAEVLRSAGYATLAAVSAPHLNPQHSNFGQGFDVFLEAERGLNLTAGERNDELFGRIRGVADRRFFAWVHYFDAHGDYAPPEPYASMYPRRDEHEPIEGRGSMDLAEDKKAGFVDPDEIVPLYKGEISYMDAQIGELLDLLDELSITEETLVVLVADHGESMTEKGIYFAHAGMYEQVLRIPLIMRLPGRVDGGIEIETLASAVDVFPTVIELLGIEPELSAHDGVSLVPAFENPEFEAHDFVVAEAVRGVIGALYMGDYKYIKPYTSEWSMPEARLFNPTSDPAEDRDLRHDEPEKLEAMERFLDAWIESARATGLASTRHLTLDPETERALRNLGYIR